MAKPVDKPASENLDEMLKRIRQENMALRRLIDAVKNLSSYPEKSSSETNH
jgi:sulfur transfer protein SufE